MRENLAKNLTNPALTVRDDSGNVEADGWVRVGPEQHEFHVAEFKHPHFFSVAATISISPSSRTYQLKKKGFTDWQEHGLYSIGHVSPEGLITVGTPVVGGRLFPRNVKETYLYEVARVLGFEEPHFVGKPSIAAEHVSKAEAKRIGRGETKLETHAEREARTGNIYVRLSDGTARRFHEPRVAMDWAAAQIKGNPGARAGIYREGISGGKERIIDGMETNEYGHVQRASYLTPGWSVNGDGGFNRAGRDVEAHAIADFPASRVGLNPYPEESMGKAVFGSSRKYDDEIRNAMARAFFVSWYASEQERRREDGLKAKLAGPGEDWMDVAPNTSNAAKRHARAYAVKLSDANGDATLTDLYAAALNAGGSGPAKDFGHYVAMQAMGHGVSWFDDNPQFGMKIPHGDFYG